MMRSLVCLAYGVFKNRQYGLNVESVAFQVNPVRELV